VDLDIRWVLENDSNMFYFHLHSFELGFDFYEIKFIYNLVLNDSMYLFVDAVNGKTLFYRLSLKSIFSRVVIEIIIFKTSSCHRYLYFHECLYTLRFPRVVLQIHIFTSGHKIYVFTGFY